MARLALHGCVAPHEPAQREHYLRSLVVFLCGSMARPEGFQALRPTSQLYGPQQKRGLLDLLRKAAGAYLAYLLEARDVVVSKLEPGPLGFARLEEVFGKALDQEPLMAMAGPQLQAWVIADVLMFMSAPHWCAARASALHSADQSVDTGVHAALAPGCSQGTVTLRTCK